MKFEIYRTTHKHITLIPTIAEDELDPFQYRVYGHLLRVCDDNRSIPSRYAMAKHCKMTEDDVSSALKRLNELGYIAITYCENGYDPMAISLLDKWTNES